MCPLSSPEWRDGWRNCCWAARRWDGWYRLSRECRKFTCGTERDRDRERGSKRERERERERGRERARGREREREEERQGEGERRRRGEEKREVGQGRISEQVKTAYTNVVRCSSVYSLTTASH